MPRPKLLLLIVGYFGLVEALSDHDLNQLAARRGTYSVVFEERDMHFA